MSIISNNLILDTDSYKASHWLQYPPKTTAMYSYMESRGGLYSKTVFFGLQYYLEEYLSKSITPEMVDDADIFFQKHGLTFNKKGWMRIAKDLGGKLPIRIHAAPEGMIIPTNNVLLTVESTDPETFWIVSWLETLLVRLWYPITVATRSFHIKERIYQSLKKSADNPDLEIDFKLHDFGARGTSSQETTAIGGAAHLINFKGSDSVVGVLMANHYYDCDMAGFSIPAAEHSTITSWGQNNEEAAYKNMLHQFANPGKIVAVVSDSYNIWHAIDVIWGEKLKQDVINSGATIVIRPDSGDPATIVLAVLNALDDQFGSTVNSKGYKVLNYVRVIQGDGVNERSIQKILDLVMEAGFSTTNINFGMGGALLQQLDRDTQKMAYKCSQVTIDGKAQPVFKDPVTDPGKKSKHGKLGLYMNDGHFQTLALDESQKNILVPVFENGKILVRYTFDEIRETVMKSFSQT